MSNIAELKFFGIITGEEEQKFIAKIEDWDMRKKLVSELNKIR